MRGQQYPRLPGHHKSLMHSLGFMYRNKARICRDKGVAYWHRRVNMIKQKINRNMRTVQPNRWSIGGTWKRDSRGMYH